MNETATRAAEDPGSRPRDGFQSIPEPVPTDTKIGIIEGLLWAGYYWRVEHGLTYFLKFKPCTTSSKCLYNSLRDI